MGMNDWKGKTSRTRHQWLYKTIISKAEAIKPHKESRAHLKLLTLVKANCIIYESTRFCVVFQKKMLINNLRRLKGTNYQLYFKSRKHLYLKLRIKTRLLSESLWRVIIQRCVAEVKAQKEALWVFGSRTFQVLRYLRGHSKTNLYIEERGFQELERFCISISYLSLSMWMCSKLAHVYLTSFSQSNRWMWCS